MTKIETNNDIFGLQKKPRRTFGWETEVETEKQRTRTQNELSMNQIEPGWSKS